MLTHFSTFKSFCMFTLVPKKGSGSMGDIRNYMGSSLSKIFDNCVISNQCRSLYSGDLQLTYKSLISTIHCVNSVYETINHYVSNSSAAHVYTLDACKAFNRVNLLTLFLRILIHSYRNQKMFIK